MTAEKTSRDCTFVRFPETRSTRQSTENQQLFPTIKERTMRKTKILPVIALGAITLGTISSVLPAGASVPFGEDDATPPVTQPAGTSVGAGGGGGGTPVGGAATGGGGMADASTPNPSAALWIAAGGAGLALVGTGVAARRRYRAAVPSGASSNAGI
jgi:hypothetical protein